MLCQNCKKNEATTHIKRVLNGEATESHLCHTCAQSLGYTNFFDDFSFNMPSLFAGLFNDTLPAIGTAYTERCEKCGSSFDDIVKSGYVGCAECYEKFYDKLLPSIQRIHGKARHSGKKPAVTAVKEEVKPKEKSKDEIIADYEKDMQKAVNEQNFEQAAIIRDEIKKLKGEN